MKRRLSLALPVALGLGAAGLIAIVLLLRFSGTPGRLLVPFSAYLPFLIIPFAVVAVIALAVFRGAGRARLPLAAVAVLLPVVVYGPRLIPRLHPPVRDMVRVATWNVFLCRYGISGIRETIGRIGADIIALQEVVASETDGPDRAQLDAIVGPMGYRWEFVGYRPSKPGRQPGIAICVREPVKLLTVERRVYHPGGRWRYVFAEVEMHGRRVNVVIPHLYPFAFDTAVGSARGEPGKSAKRLLRRVVATTYWHLQEGNELLRLVSTFRDPTILMGDFNSAPDHPIHWRLRRQLIDCVSAAGKGLASTYTFMLPVRIDYVYVTPSIQVHAAEVVSTAASDHRPVVALLSVPDATTR